MTSAPSPHVTIGPFRLLSMLGSGGMGEVWLGEHMTHKVNVALKIMTSDRARKPEFAERFEREVEVMARMNHPGAAMVLDMGVLEETVESFSANAPFIVMEYIEGKPLDVYCDTQRVPIAKRLEIFRKVCAAVHHAHTNLGDRDPDSFGTAHRYNKHPKLANFTKLAPGSGTWYSYFFLFYSFMFHAQLVLWMQTRRREEFKGFERNKAIRQALLCGAAWLVLAVLSGPLALFTVLIPLMMANALGQGYILTNHMLRPQMDNNHPVDNSMSVRQLRWLDPLHFHFSHHVEHHLFPKMGSDQAPKVRAWLQREMPDRYVCPSHARALVALYQTPRVYQDAHTLVDPLDRSRTVDVMALQGELR